MPQALSERSDYVVAVSSGLVLGAGVLVPFLWPLVLCAVVPFLALLRGKALSRTFFVGVLFGLCHVAIALAWFWFTMPLDWLPQSEGLNTAFVVGVPWIVLACVLALPFGVWAMIVSRLPRNIGYSFWVGCTWVCAELASAFLYSLLSLSDSTFLGVDFSIHWIGYALAYNGVFLQLAWYGGVFALSFFALCINALLLQFFLREVSLKRGAEIVLIFSVLLAVPWFRFDNKENSLSTTLRVAAVALFIETNHIAAQDMMTLQEKLAYESPDVLLFPEGFGVEALFKNDMHLSSKTETIVSEKVFDSGVRAGRLALVSADRIVTHIQDKHFLLPFGEYIPYAYAPFARLLGTTPVAEKIKNEAELYPGAKPRFVPLRHARAGVLFCSESMSPVLYGYTVAQGANVLLNTSSYGWFHGSHFVFEKMQSMAQVRAVETDRWYVQASHMAPTFVLDNRGRVQSESAWGISDIHIETVLLRNSRTPYVFLLSFLNESFGS